MNWNDLFELLIPIGVCVILPIFIVWLNIRSKMNETNRKADVMLKAIEAGKEVDADYFKPAEKVKTVKGQLLGKLTGACITFFIGAFVLAIVWYLSVKGTIGSEEILGFSVMGGILVAIGIALFIAFFVGKNMLAKEIEAEENKLAENQQLPDQR
ncbi:MAG: hypothetical protein J6X89_06975 [Bacteroidales bacterium]|nr:hypothetical protein [Bacteroidales bacterium]